MVFSMLGRILDPAPATETQPPSSPRPRRVQHCPGTLKDKTFPAAAIILKLHAVHPAPGEFRKKHHKNGVEIGN